MPGNATKLMLDNYPTNFDITAESINNRITNKRKTKILHTVMLCMLSVVHLNLLFQCFRDVSDVNKNFFFNSTLTSWSSQLQKDYQQLDATPLGKEEEKVRHLTPHYIKMQQMKGVKFSVRASARRPPPSGG